MLHKSRLPSLLPCLALLIFFSGCSKGEDDVSGNARISLTHSATEAPALDAFIDAEKITTAPLSFGNTTGVQGDPYINTNAGIRYLRISTDGTKNVVQGNVPLAVDGVYSVFAYDSIGTGGVLKTLILTDKLTAPADNKTHIRFLQLSPDTGRITLQFTNTTDTVVFSGRSYLGSQVIDASLGNFSAINAGDYTIRVTTAGTITPVLYTVPISLNEGKIYTIYTRGKKANGIATPTGFNISTIAHN